MSCITWLKYKAQVKPFFRMVETEEFIMMSSILDYLLFFLSQWNANGHINNLEMKYFHVNIKALLNPPLMKSAQNVIGLNASVTLS